MQPAKYLNHWLQENTSDKHYLFTPKDLRALFPDLTNGAFKVLLNRALSSGLLNHLCRGLYIYPQKQPQDGLILYHAAAMLRANSFNYLSLETVLSDAGVISQIPLNWISLMSSGRSYEVDCGKYGTIEFIHTKQKPENLSDLLIYDSRYGLWKANIKLAIRDMKRAHRNCDLIDWEVVDELI